MGAALGPPAAYHAQGSHVWSPSSPGKPVARRRGSVRWTPALVAALLAGYMLWRAHSSGPQAQQAAAGGGGKAAGAAVTGEGAATAPPQQCAPIQSFFPWGAHCQRLQHVCVDSGQLIFYDEMFQSGSGRDPARLPTLKIDRTRLHRFPWRRRPGGGAAEDDAAAEQDEAAAEQVEADVADEQGEEEDVAEEAGRGSGNGSAAPQRHGRMLAYEAKARAPSLLLRRVAMVEICTTPHTGQAPCYLARPACSPRLPLHAARRRAFRPPPPAAAAGAPRQQPGAPALPGRPLLLTLHRTRRHLPPICGELCTRVPR